ncbi:hypothetical protein GQX74_000587 [Glossina fuscipes]|nr:hypothetical protein GQX74_000587 [Glossina fuscipes]
MATPVLAPKPVHPTPMRNHGLLGISYVRQHMMVDDRWAANALIEEFHDMANLLTKRLIFKNLETNAYRKTLKKSARRLRIQCRDGRSLLQNVMNGDNIAAIRNVLINHKDMQRLYQKMNVFQVVDNINQRTFVMRKERDRLNHRLARLKDEYKRDLLERATIENRIKYQNEFILEEEFRMREFTKKIENSDVRLTAIRTINSTYKKIIQILRHDEIFYEPILRSLSRDIDDQASFIKHILYLGMPAIAKFNQLSEEFRQMDEKSRKSTQFKLSVIMGFKRTSLKRFSNLAKLPKENVVVNISKRYTRETKSMLKLKEQLEEIEIIIKKIKVATLCSRATEIFPRIKVQMEHNIKLMKRNEIGTISNEFLIFKNKVAEEQESVLLHNYFEEEEDRINRIRFLEEAITVEDRKEATIIRHMKHRTDTFVVLRYVDKPSRIVPLQYPNTYLKLPLLKFDMLIMRASAPPAFEQNTKAMLSMVERKLTILMSAYKYLLGRQNIQMTPTQMRAFWRTYHEGFLEIQNVTDEKEAMRDKNNLEDGQEIFEDAKLLQTVPNRKQIKAQSARIVEELSKKED